MIDIANSGYVCFGAATDTPGPDGVVLPTAGGHCTVVVKYKGKGKVQKATAQGKDGARATFTGAEVCEIEIALEWSDLEPWTDEIEEALTQLAPEGANKGKAWDFTARFAAVHNVDAVLVEGLDGPDPTEGSDRMTAKLKCSGWSKAQQQQSGPGASDTATEAQQWTPDQGGGVLTAKVNPGTTVQNFGGVPGNAVHFPGAPQVKP